MTSGQCGAPRRSSREGRGAGGLHGFGVNVPEGCAVGAASHSCGRGRGAGEGWAAQTLDWSGGVQARFSGVTCCLLTGGNGEDPQRAEEGRPGVREGAPGAGSVQVEGPRWGAPDWPWTRCQCWGVSDSSSASRPLGTSALARAWHHGATRPQLSAAHAAVSWQVRVHRHHPVRAPL